MDFLGSVLSAKYPIEGYKKLKKQRLIRNSSLMEPQRGFKKPVIFKPFLGNPFKPKAPFN